MSMDAPRNPVPNFSPQLTRYSRQMLFAPVGEQGQLKLLQSRVVLIGCGALGANLANLLVRSGLGHLRIIDRDFLELSNLQRQALFDEEDVRQALPKSEAAARKLRAINSEVTIEPLVCDVTRHNITELAEGFDLLLDGTDNFETRYLINDLAVQTARPWIYGAVVAASGLSLPILPGQTPCLRCVFEQYPSPEMNPTCDTVGILAPVVTQVASHQALEAIKILTGHRDAVDRRLLSFDAWSGRCMQIEVQAAYEQGECPCCKGRQFDYLDGRLGGGGEVLCGRNAVQISPPDRRQVDLTAIAARLRSVADLPPTLNAFLCKAEIAPHTITIFADGRVIVTGTHNVEEARTLHARYIGG